MASGERTRRHWSVAGLISSGAHAAPIAAALVGGLAHHGRTSACVDAGAGPITVELMAPANIASVPVPGRREVGPVAPNVTHRRGREIPRRPASGPPLPPPPPGPDPLQPPPFHDPAGDAPVAHGSAPSAPSRPTPPPTPPSPTLPASEASYLRIHETYPHLPAAMLIQGRMYSEFVELCVDTGGRVASVNITRGTTPELDELARAAILTWRYRPYLVAGAPSPFCHRMIIHFEVD
jgi:TonB family protein